MNKAYAEFGEDQWALENMRLPESGFYVDLGCAWPFLYSGSAFLRDRGWTGVNIDANPVYEPQWKGVAPFTCCVIGDGNPVSFECHGVPELSRIGEAPGSEIRPTKRLEDLLAYSPHVDYLTVDLEGHEFAALQTFDWAKNTPLVVVSEYSTHCGARPDDLPAHLTYNEAKHAIEDFRVKEMLEGMGYRERHRTVANIIFTK